MGLKADKERISVYLDRELKGWLVERAKQDNRSMSNYIEATMEQMKHKLEFELQEK